MFIKESSVNNPILTIIIPTFKRCELLKETLDSCISIRNEFKDVVDLIIIDNDPLSASEKSATSELLNNYIDYSFISYWVNESNLGMFGNWNKGVQIARTDWITILHDDDFICQGFVQQSLKQIYKSESNLFYFSPSLQDERKKFFDPITFVNRFRKISLVTKRKSTVNIIPLSYIFENPHFGTLGVFFKKQNALEIGLFNSQYYPSSDFRFFLEYAMKFGEITYIQLKDTCCVYRISVNESLKEDVYKGFIKTTYQVNKEMIDTYVLNKKLKNKLLDYIESYNIFLELRMPQRFRAKTSTLSYLKVFFMKIYLSYQQYIILIFNKFLNQKHLKD